MLSTAEYRGMHFVSDTHINKIKVMKKYSYLFSILLAVFTLQACGSSDDGDTVETAQEMNENKDGDNAGNDNMQGTMAVSENDSKFMVETANSGMMEVEASKVAQQKATNAQVKAFADMMVNDHTKANDELKQLAASKNVTLPAAVGEDNQEDLKDLSEKSGKDFDKAYINMMVSDHKKTVGNFEDLGDNTDSDGDLKAWVNKMIPALKQHLDQAQKLDDTIKK